MIIQNVSLLNKDFAVERHMYVVTEGDRIIYVGDTDPLEAGPGDSIIAMLSGEDRQVIDGRDKLLMPAFYNTHCHSSMTLLRGYGEGLPLDKWLTMRVFPFEAKLTGEAKYYGTLLAGIELIRSGCVSISDMYSHLTDVAQAMYELGMKANICNGFINPAEDASFFEDNAYRDTEKLLDWIRDHDDGRIIADASIHSEYLTDEKGAYECISYARKKGMNMCVHIAETEKEVLECRERRDGMSPIQYFDSLGLFELPVTAAHCVWLDDYDIELIRKNNVFVALNISSNLKLGSGIAPIKKYYDAGLRLTIGTDGASSNNNLNMMEEMHLNAMIARGQSCNANAVPAAETIKMATLNGAMAQGRPDCGTIEPGKKADFILIDLDKPHLIPDCDTVANIVFSAQNSDICMTVCDGKILYKDGEMPGIDEEEVKAKAAEHFRETLTKIR